MSSTTEQSPQELETQTSNLSSPRRVARVKWFNSKTGFGFITDTQSAEDLFVHHSGITVPDADVYRYLKEGEYVEYDVKLDDKGQKCATDITGISRGPLLCQRFFTPKDSTETNTSSRTSTNQRSGGRGRGRGRGRGGRGRGK